MAPDSFTSVSDRNEFTKFTKFLAYKGVQVIIESRKGVKIEINSKVPVSDADWFNLQIPDSVEVNVATKKALPSDKVLDTIRSRLNVEISVQTEDGDEMVLELWTMRLDETQYDTSLKAMNTIYFRMGILLKSLITVTRITPAYHISRKQRTESFTIFYKIYSGEPKIKNLGESVKKIQAGLLKTPLGGISFSVMYRTNLSMSPMKSQDSTTLMLKSDHFEMSPRHGIDDRKHRDKDAKALKQIDLNKPLRLAAFTDEQMLNKVCEDFFRKIPIPKCSLYSDPIDIKAESKSDSNPETAMISKSPTTNELPPKKFAELRGENEPPLKLLHFPFSDSHPITELAEFYKDFFNAPHLKLAAEESYESTTEEFNEYENSTYEFDELLADMCRSAESGN